MTRSRRKFVKRCVIIGGGALCAPLLPGVLQASPDSSGTLQSREAVCPKSAPPAKTMWALRIEDLKKGSEERLPLSCLQGLVNRRQPQIFLAYDRFDVQWLDWLRERGDVNEVRWVGPKELYEKFLPLVKELVVTDPDLPASVNVATMLAAVEGWLPVTPRLRKAFQRVNVALDLRGKWKKNIEAYRWFYATHGSRMSRRACAHYDPGQFETPRLLRAIQDTPGLGFASRRCAAQPGGFAGGRSAVCPRPVPEAPRKHPVPGVVGSRAGWRRRLRRKWAVFRLGPGQPTRQVPDMHGV